LGESERREGDVGFLREADAGARDVVRLAEGDLLGENLGGLGRRGPGKTYTFADEVLGEVGGEHVGGEGSLHLLREDLRVRDGGHQFESRKVSKEQASAP
jgi:hypothetical protein